MGLLTRLMSAYSAASLPWHSTRRRGLTPLTASAVSHRQLHPCSRRPLPVTVTTG
jgi:hypothetical protein